MNVLFLTPDAVGGTLVQRLLTIYMQFHEFDRPIINIGHVELGLEKYFCPSFNREILRAKGDTKNHQHQTLAQIRDTLESVDHYKIAKLPYYNILGRQDPADQQVPFYQYLNDNFFIISCRRENLFEHALSWGLNKITHSLNVYSTANKVQAFGQFYINPVKIDPLSLEQSLNSYRQYVTWCDTYFRVASFYVYEKHLPDIEKYILSLPIFHRQAKLRTWEDVYGQSLQNWNKCHFYRSDLGSLDSLTPLIADAVADTKPGLQIGKSTDHKQTQVWWSKFRDDYNTVKDESWPNVNTIDDWENLPISVRDECRHVHKITYWLDTIKIHAHDVAGKYGSNDLTTSTQHFTAVEDVTKYLPSSHQTFINSHIAKYQAAQQSIEKMVELNILPTPVPIKKQTLSEKSRIIANFDECMDVYNQWIARNPGIAHEVKKQDLEKQINQEREFWFENTLRDRLS
jgi:hypothetical protein